MSSSAERDRAVTALLDELIEIEQRLIPTGLHVFGRPTEFASQADLLRMVASFDRPEHGARALPKLVAEGLGLDSYDELIRHNATSESRELIDNIVKEVIETFCERGGDAAAEMLKSRANVATEVSRPHFDLLAGITEHLASNHELESLLRALRGE